MPNILSQTLKEVVHMKIRITAALIVLLLALLASGAVAVYTPGYYDTQYNDYSQVPEKSCQCMTCAGERHCPDYQETTSESAQERYILDCLEARSAREIQCPPVTTCQKVCPPTQKRVCPPTTAVCQQAYPYVTPTPVYPQVTPVPQYPQVTP